MSNKRTLTLLLIAIVTSVVLLILPITFSVKITSDEIIPLIFRTIKLAMVPTSFLFMHKYIQKKLVVGYLLVLLAWIANYTSLYIDLDVNLLNVLTILYDVTSFVGIALIILGYKDNRQFNLNLINELEYITYYDKLTKLPNYNMVYSSLGIDQSFNTYNVIPNVPCKEQIDLTKKSILIYFDVDDFKMINDNLGHHYGDMLLVEIARRIRANIRKDDLAIRVSGDEFLIVVYSDTTISEIDYIVTRISCELSKTYYLGDVEININCSYGVALYPEHDNDFDEAVRKADIAMFKAKGEGNNTYAIYDDKFDVGQRERFITYNELKSAIKNNEFVVYYQAKAATSDNKITGLEALVRWKHPTKGIISPGYFIPMMEETGIIKELDMLVLKKVCNQINKWKKSGQDIVNISINVSPLFFSDKMFISLIDETLTRYKVDPNHISVEITENVALTDVEQTKFKIKQLKLRNIKVYLDDFGKGYSSLNYIKNYPIDSLKIDKAFIDEITTNVIDQSLVKSFVNICNMLGIRVVCEGVERKEQLEVIKNMGCHEYQGYLLNKPQAVEEIIHFINMNKVVN